VSDLAELIKFAKEKVSGPPVRLHDRSVAGDGSPQWSRDFERWLAFSPYKVRVLETKEPCDHNGGEPDGCNSCAIYSEDGSVLVNTGQRVRRSLVYQQPDAAALDKMRRLPVQPGYPRLDQVVVLATRAGFTPEVLLNEYPAIDGVPEAERLVSVALRKFRSLYSAEPPVRVRRRLRLDD
jgi:hypothetical protein